MRCMFALSKTNIMTPIQPFDRVPFAVAAIAAFILAVLIQTT